MEKSFERCIGTATATGEEAITRNPNRTTLKDVMKQAISNINYGVSSKNKGFINEVFEVFIAPPLPGG